MSCFVCTEYNGLKEPCNKGICIQNGSESFNCNYYQYNQQLIIGDDGK